MTDKKIIFLIFAIGFVLRIVGINFGLPFAYHDDEPIIVNYALAYASGDFNPHVFNISPFLSYILFFIYGAFFVIGRLFGAFHQIKDFAYLYLNDPTFFYLIGRVAYGLLCGSASIVALYVLGKKCFDKSTGLLAAFFLAVNFLHVRDSHYIYFDIPLTLCVIIFFIKAIDFFKPVRLKNYIALSLLLGLAISVKNTGSFLVFPFMAVVIYNFFISREVSLRIKFTRILVCPVVVGSAFFAGNPFAFLDFKAFFRSGLHLPVEVPPPFHHLLVSLFGGCGMAMVLLGLVSMAVILVTRKNKRALIIILFTIIYYSALHRSSQPGERLVMPLVPFILLFAAWLFVLLARSLRKYKIIYVVIPALLAVLIFPSLIRIYYANKLFLRQDTRTQAYHWIKANIVKNSRIALDATQSCFPRLEKNKEQFKEREKYISVTSFRKPQGADQMKARFMRDNPYYPAITYYLFYLRDEATVGKKGFLTIYPDIPIAFNSLGLRDIQYVVLSQIIFKPKYANFMEELKRSYRLIKVFSPYRRSIQRKKPIEFAPIPAAAFTLEELRDRISYGPYIEIYERIQ
ncbi:MAG: glycosyltransferase family 39 protein [Candidatus Omnitrophica bacterium]|nr:glycosyltransferase family 39 protein [Candidatus Omnitrophota bacterium]